MLSLCAASADDTEAIGRKLAPLLSAGDFIALYGELGAGKTCFARGIAAGLLVDPAIPVTSPTYTLLNVYQGRLPLYHFDLYRVSQAEIFDLGFEDYFYGDGVSIVEWPDRLDELPDDRLEIAISYTKAGRRIAFAPHGRKMEEMVDNVIAAVNEKTL